MSSIHREKGPVYFARRHDRVASSLPRAVPRTPRTPAQIRKLGDKAPPENSRGLRRCPARNAKSCSLPMEQPSSGRSFRSPRLPSSADCRRSIDRPTRSTSEGIDGAVDVRRGSASPCPSGDVWSRGGRGN